MAGWRRTPGGVIVPYTIECVSGAIVGLTNAPSAATEAFGNELRRRWVDARPFRQAMVGGAMTTAGPGGAFSTRLQILVDGVWTYLDGSSGPSCGLPDNATSYRSNWVDIAAACRVENWVRWVFVGGDDTTDPNVCALWASFR